MLEVDASMQGTLAFRDPVNLRINGNFEGNLNTKGNLMVGESAKVRADIVGESIVIAGTVTGNISAAKELKLISPASVVGDIKTPVLSIEEGAVIEGNIKMQFKEGRGGIAGKALMTADELANYLEVDISVVNEWVSNGKLPAVKEGNSWRFDRLKIDEWVSSEKIR